MVTEIPLRKLARLAWVIHRYILELPIRCTTADPPIHDTSQRLETLLPTTLALSTLGHCLEDLKGLDVVYRPTLDEQCERTETIRQSTRVYDFGEEAGFGSVR